MTAPVVVMGGGIIGLTAALHLAERGHDVVVIERDHLGRGASWGNAGWVTPALSAPLPAPGVLSYTLRSIGRRDSPVYLAPRADPALARWLAGFARRCNARDHHRGLAATARLNERTLALYDSLEADGLDLGMRRDGLLMAFLDRQGAARELEHLQALRPHGHPVPDEVIDGDAARVLEPALGPGVASALLLEAERHVDPGRLTLAIAARLRGSGVQIIEGTTVLGFEAGRSRIHRVTTDQGDVDAGSVLLAAGAWSGQLAARLGARLPLQGGKGYSFSVTPPVLPSRPIYLAESKVGVTPFEEHVRLAGTMELSGLDTRVDMRRIGAIATGARRYLDGWPALPVADSWAGLRPMAPDGLPIMGALPGFENVFVSTGHAMLGITLGPAAGEAMAELITTGRVPPVLEPFTPARFT